MKNYLILKEAAQYVRRSPCKIYRLVREGKIPYHRPDRNYLFVPAELDAWVRSQDQPRSQAVLSPFQRAKARVLDRQERSLTIESIANDSLKSLDLKKG